MVISQHKSKQFDLFQEDNLEHYQLTVDPAANVLIPPAIVDLVDADENILVTPMMVDPVNPFQKDRIIPMMVDPVDPVELPHCTDDG